MKTNLKYIVVSLMAALMLAACNVSSEPLPEEDLAYATVEINPGVGIMVNAQNRVVYAHALNADGEMVMLQLQLEGKTLDDAVDEIAEETVNLDFVTEETVDPDAELDIVSNLETLQAQVRTNLQTRIGNAFEGQMIQMTTQTRTYTQAEIDEATAKETTPLKLRLMKQVMIGNDDLLEDEVAELDVKGLLNQARNGATQMKQIAATLGADFLEERQAIQDEYKPQIQALKDAIEAAIANSEDTAALEQELEELRQAMVAEIKAIVANYKQQTTQARENWQNEADTRRGTGSSANASHTSIVSSAA